MNRRGNTAVMVALASTTILGIAALTVDLGYVRVIQAELQNVADAAAHGGSAQLDGTDIGITNARTMAAYIASQNPVAGQPLALAGEDVTVGYWDAAARTFTATSDPMYANTVRVDANLASLGLLFAPIAVGTTSMPVRARSAMKASQGGSGAVDCYLPVALPSCLIDLRTLDGMQTVTLNLNPPAIDNVGWGRPGGNPNDAWSRAQIIDCTASGWARVGDEIGLQNGVATDAMREFVDQLDVSTTTWDTTKWGAMPARMTGSSVSAASYGRTVEGAVPVFESGSSYCVGSGGSFSGTTTIKGFIWGSVYDVKHSGAAGSRTVRMRVDVLNEHDVGALMGGPDYGVVTEDTPAMVE